MTGKNRDMGKSIDKVAISLLLFLLAFLLFYRLTDAVLTSIFASVLVVATIALFLALIRPKTPKDKLSKRNFIRYILLKGNTALKDILSIAFSGKYEIRDIGDHTVLSVDGEKILVYYAYKFGSLSEEDVAKSYRIAERENCDAIYALTGHLDRKALAVTEYIPQRFTVINAQTLYKYLSKRDLIPKKEALPRKKSRALGLLRSAFKRDHTKYYLWAGLTTALIALFTPIVTYYIVFSFVNLMLAIMTVVFSERSDGKDQLFRE